MMRNIQQYTEQFPPIGNYLAQTISITEVDNKKLSFNLQYIHLTFYLLCFQLHDKHGGWGASWPQSFAVSSIRVFSNESAVHIRWPKYWSFSYIISPFNEYSGLIFLGIDWV